MKLQAYNLSFSYIQGKKVLENFDLSLTNQEKLGIWAPSGTGKTTLCKILASYLKPSRGQVLLDGQDIHKMKGYCPIQLIGQHPEYSVNPRLKIGASLKDSPPINASIFEGLGIDIDWLNRYPHELSGGEIQRCCIARALGNDTRFLIADEITTMLDIISQSQIWSFLLAELERRQIGLIAVTHNQHLLSQITERVITLP